MCQMAVPIPPSSTTTQVSPAHKNHALHGTESCSSPPWKSNELNMLREKNRPGMIEIPPPPPLIVTTQISSSCGDDDDDETQKVEELSVEEREFFVFCKKGKKGVLEDRYSAVVGLHGDPQQAIFGVFDGHGGVKAAEFAANNLDKNIIAEMSRRCLEKIEVAIRNGYLNTDAEFLKQNVDGGTCCVTALINHRNVFISNAGDCRAVLSRGGVAYAITSDHRPSRDDERDRIENQGGYIDYCRGAWRVHGTLAVSRAIGDRHLKEWVTADPETKVLRLEPDCEFLVLASDGLWDQVSNQEAVDIIRPLCIGVEKREPFAACKKLVDLSVRRGSVDDVCVLIARLGCFIH